MANTKAKKALKDIIPKEVADWIHPNLKDISVGQSAGEYQRSTVCACCGKEVYIPEPRSWVYKLKFLKKNDDIFHLYFCSYSCYMRGVRELWDKVVTPYIWK